MVSGESHYFLGQRYLLQIVEHQGKSYIALENKSVMLLYVKPTTNHEKRLEIIQQWYRAQLKAIIPALMDKWIAIIGVEINEWGVKK
jgi:predicted metal-dependent hydrolase